jgi:quercetin dioxygenase-like cupin family protein
VLPEALEWFSPPGNAGLKAAWVVGAEQESGLYALRVRLAPGARIAPHTHPDARTSTVLSGTLYVGFGATVDETAMVAVPTGAVYVAPANQPHYLWARDGEVVYQESGVGPTRTVAVAGP